MPVAHSAPSSGVMNVGGPIAPAKPASRPTPDGLGSGWYRQVRPLSRDTHNAGRPPPHDPPTQPVRTVENTAKLLAHPNGIAPGVGLPCPPPVVSSASRHQAPPSAVRKIAIPLLPAAAPRLAVTQPVRAVTMSGGDAPIAAIRTRPNRSHVRPLLAVR